MRFIVDAQLPRRLAHCMRSAGHDAVHPLDLPAANRTTDDAILELATREQRIVVTKDSDFVDTHLLAHKPEKLFLNSTGNISNSDLEALLLPNLAAIVAAFSTSDFVELTRRFYRPFLRGSSERLAAQSGLNLTSPFLL